MRRRGVRSIDETRSRELPVGPGHLAGSEAGANQCTAAIGQPGKAGLASPAIAQQMNYTCRHDAPRMGLLGFVTARELSPWIAANPTNTIHARSNP
jgi:hypothetical protein